MVLLLWLYPPVLSQVCFGHYTPDKTDNALYRTKTDIFLQNDSPLNRMHSFLGEHTVTRETAFFLYLHELSANIKYYTDFLVSPSVVEYWNDVTGHT